MIKIGLAQINPCVGDLEQNAKKIISYVKKAKSRKVDLVIFPELALTGYPPEDLLLKPHFAERNKYFLNIVRGECIGIAAIIGYIDREKEKNYNACALIQDKKIIDIYRKACIPNYGVFDEKRYFSSGQALSFYNFKGYDFFVSICEDIWEKKFLDALGTKKADFLINISASPFYLGKIFLREKMLSECARKLNSFVFYCNLVGGQDELVFDGTSKVYSPKGKLIKVAKRFCEDLLIFNLNKKKNYSAIKLSVKEEEEASLALKLGLADYVNKNRFKKVILGLSGGIDSAVVASLAAYALGNKRVEALIMPSRYTSKGTLADAERICKNLGIKCYTISIDEIFDVYLKILKPYFESKNPDKTEENIQPRIRGNLLMAFSNKFGYLVLNTGNKSEVSCGYCTLYGDMVGGFGVLKDVSKVLVYKLAHYLNRLRKKNIIPSSVIKRAPSAELKPNQKDSDTLPLYRMLDPVLKLYIEKRYSLDKIVKAGYKRKLVKKVIEMVDSNEYKRRQAPIGIKITPCAFGKDRRMPITNRFSG